MRRAGACAVGGGGAWCRRRRVDDTGVNRAREHRHHEGRGRLAWPERAGHLIRHRRHAFQIGRNRQRIRLRQTRVTCHGMTGARMRPSGVSPLVIAVTICSSVQLPRPVALSGVRLGATNTPRGGMPKPTSEPPRNLLLSALPRKCPGVWQSVQLPMVTRYLPRATSCASAAAARNGTARPETPASKTQTPGQNVHRRPDGFPLMSCRDPAALSKVEDAVHRILSLLVGRRFSEYCSPIYVAANTARVSTPNNFTSRGCYFGVEPDFSLARDGRPRSRLSQQRAPGPPVRSSDKRSDAAPARRRRRPRRRRSRRSPAPQASPAAARAAASGTAVPSLTRLPVMKTVLIGTPAMLRTAAFCTPSAAAQIAALHWPVMNSEPPSISAVSTSGSAWRNLKLQRDFGDDHRRQENRHYAEMKTGAVEISPWPDRCRAERCCPSWRRRRCLSADRRSLRPSRRSRRAAPFVRDRAVASPAAPRPQ